MPEQGPHNLPETSTTGPPGASVVTQETPETPRPSQTEGTTLPEGAEQLYKQLHPEQAVERPRDANGQFVADGKTEATDSGAYVVPEVDPVWAAEAKNLGFSEAEISSMPDMVLKSAVRGRQMEYAQRYAPQQPYIPPQQFQQEPMQQPQQQQMQQQQQVPQQQEPLGDFKLNLDEDQVAEEIAGPVKAMADHMNQLKATLMQENNQLRQELGSFQQAVQQSAGAAQQQSQIAEGANYWDGIAAEIPGLVEQIGKPSQAMGNRSSVQNDRWEALAQNISRRGNEYAQSMGYQNIESLPRDVMLNIAKDSFSRMGFASRNGNGNGNASQQLPGAVIPSSGRSSDAQPVSASGDPDHDRAVAAATQQWNQFGGNPFGPGGV